MNSEYLAKSKSQQHLTEPNAELNEIQHTSLQPLESPLLNKGKSTVQPTNTMSYHRMYNQRNQDEHMSKANYEINIERSHKHQAYSLGSTDESHPLNRPTLESRITTDQYQCKFQDQRCNDDLILLSYTSQSNIHSFLKEAK